MNFDEVKRLMDDSVANHEIPCSDIIVTYKGETVYRYMNGTRDDEKKVPLNGNELYFLYSTSKPITCTAALQLVEQGKMNLDDKVSDYIPEFADLMVKTEDGLKKAENPMTLRHLFSMTSGLNYDLESAPLMEQKQKNPMSSTLDMIRALAKNPLEFEPGTHFLYSLSHDVLAAVIEVVSGMSFGAYLKKNIFDVCGMTRTGFLPDAETVEQICSQYRYSEENKVSSLMEKENQYQLTPAYESGGAGLHSCVDDYIKFATEMANGNRLLKKETIDLLRTSQISGQTYIDFQDCKKGYSYGLGVRTDRDGSFVAKGEFGWDGAAGAYTLMDPDNHVAVFYATHVRDYGGYLYDELHLNIRDAIYKAIFG